MKPDLKVLKREDAPKPPQDEKQSPAQSEMPFAVVDGEPITTLPQDLYIPPYALQVFLEAFEGPLDLLLYLIRRQNIDILDIPIAEITKQYVQYIELMKEMQLELAGEYLVMAAMLAEIKSRMLLPRQEKEDEEEDDPRAELVRRLQEYERYKKAAHDIDELPRLERDVFTAQAEAPERKVVEKLPDVTLKELLLAFHDVLKRAEMFSNLRVTREPLSVRQRMSEVLSRVKAGTFTGFADLFDPEEGRMGVAVTFLALLELLRESLIEVVQSDEFAPLHVRAASTVRLVSGEGDEPPAAETS
ncbi:MAG: segregation/condensation protein A [Gammaproteobacteria bacterium]|jgi:segregation and condensation protein A|nr:segregation/condensation protein A [Gammaproteobacteria bacterium]MDH3758478.1 segregation/condensation protein A [Gammaproteobacteria bacterium]MDH3848408.1 segregation/condensation protein A [Gammaproteobacteria bacterium]MDH3864090.1 segregation/condensation protein A [Gammaproteobacteria bacterium]MDH4005873.1 segregation/condensation protein A [Gammaproteobacteria bacterium]